MRYSIVARTRLILVSSVLLLLAWPDPAAAYVGPGAGLTVIGAALAFIASIVFGILGFLWYPLKRLFRAISKRGADRRSDSIDS